jgi:hypothetical protein
MSIEQKEKNVQQIVESINAGKLEGVDQYIDRDFFNYSPAENEQTAPEILKEFLRDLHSAIPDLEIDVFSFEDHGDELSFSMKISGTHLNTLWGSPGAGDSVSWTSRVTSRFTDGHFAFEWRDLPIRELLGALRQVGLVPAREDMDKPHEHPVSVPEFLLRLLFTGQVEDKQCSHLDAIQVIEPTANVCQECVDQGDIWPALRMCLFCGYVGCCDTSKNKHMKLHYQETGHPIFRSIRLDESWVWCYEDDAFFSGKILEKYG